MKNLNIMININYKIKKLGVKIRKHHKIKRYKAAIDILTSDEKKLFFTVLEIAKKNRYAIKFDPKYSETLIALPEMLITLKNETVTIENTNGFLIKQLPQVSFEYLLDCIEHEAHIERRKIKYETKLRINNFLNNIEHNQ